MPQVISFINMKGGVGKTTLIVNVAYALASQHNKKVLLIDVDPQFNASTYLMTDEEYISHRDDKEKRTVVDIFQPRETKHFDSLKGIKKKKKKTKHKLASYFTRVYDNEGQLDLIPSDLRLIVIQNSERGTENRLRTFIEEKANGYDYVLIDCPPTISIFSQAAILASDSYLVPIKPDPLSTIGLPLLERWLDNFTENAGIEIECIGIVFCFVRENTIQMQQVMQDLRSERSDEVFNSFLGQSVKVSESVERHLPVFLYKPRTKWARQSCEIALEFLSRTGE
jgi:chromosome partitioning protein